MKFRTVILQTGKNTTGIEVPEAIVTALGAGKKPPVTVTLNGTYTYRNTVASMGGTYLVSLSSEHRQASGFSGSDEVEVELTLDTAPREVTVPDDLASTLEQDAQAHTFWETLSYTNQLRHVLQIEGAKSAETRQRRIARTLDDLRAGKK